MLERWHAELLHDGVTTVKIEKNVNGWIFDVKALVEQHEISR